MSEHPYRMVVVQGVTARMFNRASAPGEFTTVSNAAEADKALGEEGNEHFCPLCLEYFSTAAFKRHAPSCILARAGAWERQRDKDPETHFRGRLFGPRPLGAR